MFVGLVFPNDGVSWWSQTTSTTWACPIERTNTTVVLQLSRATHPRNYGIPIYRVHQLSFSSMLICTEPFQCVSRRFLLLLQKKWPYEFVCIWLFPHLFEVDLGHILSPDQNSEACGIFSLGCRQPVSSDCNIIFSVPVVTRQETLVLRMEGGVDVYSVFSQNKWSNG